MEPFEFPRIHSFPPLYTKQPNATILENQLESWSTIILTYCEYYKITSISLTGNAIHSQFEQLNLNQLPPIFENKGIERAVGDDFRLEIFRHLIHKLKKAEYIDAKLPESGVIVYWRSLVDWANLLYEFVENSGQTGTVLTVYELTKLEDLGLPAELMNLDYNLLLKILKNVLMKQGKVQVLMSDDGSEQIGGVKIV